MTTDVEDDFTAASKSYSLSKLVLKVLAVAKRVLKEDVREFGILKIPASILGKASTEEAESTDALRGSEASALDTKAWSIWTTFIEEVNKADEEGFMKLLPNAAAELWPNILLKPIHGGESSEYTEIRDQPIDFFKNVFRPVVWPKRLKPELFWDNENDKLSESQARPFNKKEQWIYVNGMAMTKSLALRNTNDLARMFQSRVLCVHNPTKGIFSDLFECASGVSDSKDMRATYAAAAGVLSELLRDVLLDGEVETVRLVGHSQGTILTTVAVEIL
eukprot:CAMPEP_0119026876 /NCGR_PEP_ID=MMETSP1176-20130426/36202_1 /TAXON_ID=265551 /ORGANISM="Synedropsis recta cf, Strain CCMP1620" /LENGTH=275 /DNA_ID=CAMNT_0006982691 /DNA_START=167 /DNA_END=994 /DNA_ORIENTATION=+